MNRKRQVIRIVAGIFAFATVYTIIYAFYHREVSELVYIIFNLYALAAVLLCFGFVYYYERNHRRRNAETKARAAATVKNLALPAMLWDEQFTSLVMNESLRTLTEMKEREGGYDAAFTVPWVFGKKRLDAEEIAALVNARNQEYSFLSMNGVPHDMLWNTSLAFTDAQGVRYYISIGMDLADIRKMQSEIESYSHRLAAAEGKYKLTMELSEIGMLLIEQRNPNLFLSENLRQSLGLQSETVPVQKLRERVYPMDIAAFDHYMDTVRNRVKELAQKTTVMELRVAAASGEYRWYSYRCKATQNKETGRYVIGGSVLDVTPEKEKDLQMQRLAYEDRITGLSNRAKLMEMGRELFECTEALRVSYWVIVLDIDRFHLINDTCGYEAGNHLLNEFAEILKAQQNPGGFVARISGDNFALILRNLGDESTPASVVGRIQRALLTKAVGALENRALTCSAGFASMPQDGESFAEVLEHAEFALSAGKSHSGSIERYTAAMRQSIVEESDLEKKLADAVMNRQLVLYYQPKVDVNTGSVIGMEALIRWRDPAGAIIGPDRFIPVAERSHLITQITRFVLDEACRQAKLWQTMGLPRIVMSVNVSGTDFYQENIVEQINRTLQRHQLAPELLEIELTESLAIKDIELTVSRMQALREAGIGIAMDDFGTGYSSLSYIQLLPFTMIKLDRSFVADMERDPVVQEIVRSVVRIAGAKQIKTLAEGVETPEQAAMLRESGCDYIQGYVYGHPMTAQEAEQFIRDQAKHGAALRQHRTKHA